MDREAESVLLEAQYVHSVYKEIAPHFSDTRYKAWPKVRDFLEGMEPGSLVADIGCGNGKYLGVNQSTLKLGSDHCEELVSIAKCRGYEAMVCDNIHLPYRDSAFDAVISIAVIHHFATTERRVQAIRELARVTQVGGKVMIYVWALEQTKRKFLSQDVLVPWHMPSKYSRGEKIRNPSTDQSSQSSFDEEESQIDDCAITNYNDDPDYDNNIANNCRKIQEWCSKNESLGSAETVNWSHPSGEQPLPAPVDTNCNDIFKPERSNEEPRGRCQKPTLEISKNASQITVKQSKFRMLVNKIFPKTKSAHGLFIPSSHFSPVAADGVPFLSKDLIYKNLVDHIMQSQMVCTSSKTVSTYFTVREFPSSSHAVGNSIEVNGTCHDINGGGGFQVREFPGSSVYSEARTYDSLEKHNESSQEPKICIENMQSHNMCEPKAGASVPAPASFIDTTSLANGAGLRNSQSGNSFDSGLTTTCSLSGSSSKQELPPNESSKESLTYIEEAEVVVPKGNPPIVKAVGTVDADTVDADTVDADTVDADTVDAADLECRDGNCVTKKVTYEKQRINEDVNHIQQGKDTRPNKKLCIENQGNTGHSHTCIEDKVHNSSYPTKTSGSTYQRYYHVFKEGELVQLIEKYIENLHVVSTYFDHANWCVIAEKVEVWKI